MHAQQVGFVLLKVTIIKSQELTDGYHRSSSKSTSTTVCRTQHTVHDDCRSSSAYMKNFYTCLCYWHTLRLCVSLLVRIMNVVSFVYLSVYRNDLTGQQNSRPVNVAS